LPYKDPHSPEAIASSRKASRKYYKKNREKEIARCAAYNKANQDRVNRNAVLRRSEKMPPEKVLYHNAKSRSKARGVEFNIEVEDIFMPDKCPILGIPLTIGKGTAHEGSPSLDRIDPTRGYIKGNIHVISHKANTIKSNATVEEIKAVYQYIERITNEKTETTPRNTVK